MPMPEPGQRVVLVIPRDGLGEGRALPNALDEIARQGWVLTAVIDPAEHLKALQLVLDGLADVVLAARPEHLPSLRFTFDLDSAGRSRPVTRAAVAPSVRRPQLQLDPDTRPDGARRPTMLRGPA